MENKEDNIRAEYKTKTGRTLIFLKDGGLIAQELDGKRITINLNDKETLKKIKEEIGKGHTDVVR